MIDHFRSELFYSLEFEGFESIDDAAKEAQSRHDCPLLEA
jgi:hypothetical protein